ncbi:MAG: hypothetical protein R2815_14535 [Flavobacteriales bacterium]
MPEYASTPRSVGFTVMCVLTLVGNVLLLLTNLVKVGLLETGIRQGGVGGEASVYLSLLLQLVLLSCVGALLGAGLMLAGKRPGYAIYAVSNVLHILLAVCAMLIWAMTIYFLFVSVLLFVYCLIPAGFLLYFHLHRDTLH